MPGGWRELAKPQDDNSLTQLGDGVTHCTVNLKTMTRRGLWPLDGFLDKLKMTPTKLCTYHSFCCVLRSPKLAMDRLQPVKH